MVLIQKEAIRDRDEIIAMQKRIMELDERLAELRVKMLLVPSPN